MDATFIENCLAEIFVETLTHPLIDFAEVLPRKRKYLRELVNRKSCYCSSAEATAVELDREDFTFVHVNQRWGIDHEIVNQGPSGKTKSRET
jgi:hypothetical protein